MWTGKPNWCKSRDAVKFAKAWLSPLASDTSSWWDSKECVCNSMLQSGLHSMQTICAVVCKLSSCTKTTVHSKHQWECILVIMAWVKQLQLKCWPASLIVKSCQCTVPAIMAVLGIAGIVKYCAAKLAYFNVTLYLTRCVYILEWFWLLQSDSRIVYAQPILLSSTQFATSLRHMPTYKIGGICNRLVQMHCNLCFDPHCMQIQLACYCTYVCCW